MEKDDMDASVLERPEHDTHKMGDAYDGFADQFAKADQLPSWRWVGKAAMQKVLEPVLAPGMTFLDLGSASARVEAGVLVPAGVLPADMTGVEISPDQVEIAKERIPNATFIVGDVSDPELLAGKDGTFDCVFSHMVFEHLDDEQLARTCQNAHRLLKENGVFAFVVTDPSKMTDLDGNLVTTHGAFKTSAPWGGTLDNFYRSVDATVKTLEDAGFTVELNEGVNFDPEVPAGLSDEDVAIYRHHADKYLEHPYLRRSIRARRA